MLGVSKYVLIEGLPAHNPLYVSLSFQKNIYMSNLFSLLYTFKRIGQMLVANPSTHELITVLTTSDHSTENLTFLNPTTGTLLLLTYLVMHL